LSGSSVTDVSGQPIGPIFKGQEVQKERNIGTEAWNHAFVSSREFNSEAVKALNNTGLLAPPPFSSSVQESIILILRGPPRVWAPVKNLRYFKLRLNRKLYVKRHADKLNVGDVFLASVKMF
jgi:hypothetical protein